MNFSDRRSVIVVGYPKSGNTYLSRLLGELLDAPVTGFANAIPLATEGLNRTGPYVIRQLHAKPVTGNPSDPALLDAWRIATNNITTELIIHVIRDPRDVAVSVFHYWNMSSLQSAIRSVALGEHPLLKVGSWSDFNASWRAEGYFTVCFEHLVSDPYFAIHICDKLGLKITADPQVAIANQSLSAKRAQIEQDGDSRPWGKETQLHNLRKGIAGDWRNTFTRTEAELSQHYWYDDPIFNLYERNPQWYKEL